MADDPLGPLRGGPLPPLAPAAVLRARLTTTIRPDTVFVPFHWAGRGRANLLTSDALDPTSRMPAFKACAARVDRLPVGAR